MGNNAPCYKCEDRHNNCHSHCDRYIEFANKRREISDRRAKEYLVNNYIYDVSRKRKIKKNLGEL